MRYTPLALALLSVLAVPAAAHADNFTLTGTGGGFTASLNLTATPEGGGSFLITNVTGTGVNGLIPPGGFDHNDNLFFPTSNPVFDTNGFAFAITETDTRFMVDIFSAGAGVYDANFLDIDGVSSTFPVTFSVAGATPEPSGLMMLGTGIVGMAALVRRRLFA